MILTLNAFLIDLGGSCLFDSRAKTKELAIFFIELCVVVLISDKRICFFLAMAVESGRSSALRDITILRNSSCLKQLIPELGRLQVAKAQRGLLLFSEVGGHCFIDVKRTHMQDPITQLVDLAPQTHVVEYHIKDLTEYIVPHIFFIH